MSNIGYSTLSVIPSAKGFGSKLSSQIDPELASAGKKSGISFSKVLGGAIVGGFGAAIVGIGAIIHTGFGEVMDASAGTAQLAAGIKSTGNAAHVSVGGMTALASKIQAYSGQTDDSIVATEKLLLTFTNIKNSGPDKIFDLATVASADMAAKMGGDASGMAIKLGRALSDPAKGVTALTRVGVVFTNAQKDQIAAMVKSGDTIGAQKVILGELTKEFGGAAKAAGQSLPGKLAIAKRSFEDLSQSIVEGAAPAFATVVTGITGFIKGVQDGTGAGGTFRGVITTIYNDGIKPLGTFIIDTAVPAVRDFVKGFADGTGPGGKFRDILVLIYNDGVKPIADFITGTALPAIRNFVQGFADGTGPGGDFKNTLKDVYDNGVVPLADFITGTALPALKSIETWITGTGIPALSTFKDWIIKNRDTLKVLAEFIGVVLLPVFANMAVKAVASAATQVTAWVSTQVAGGTSALAQLGSHYIIVGGWVMSTAKAVASAATTAVIWGMYKAEAISGAAVSVASLVAVGAAWVWSGVTAMGAAVVMAGAWVVGLGPVAWVIAAIVAVIAIIAVIATKTTWFQTVWKAMTDANAKAWQWMWNGILAPIIRFVLNGFASITDGIAGMLRTLSNIPGFGWAKDAADKMSGAADKARALANNIKDIKDKKVAVTVTYGATWSAKTAALVSAINTANKGHILGFASGGAVPGSGYGDTQPAMLTPGEFVVRRDGSNIADALKHFGAKAVAPVGGDTFNIYEATSAMATAMQVSRRQAALGAV